jgi:AraC family transcriptional regulator of arabinose operon
MQMIEACPAGVPTIRELARITATSPTKLQQDFRQAFGCTIHHCKQQRRMALAALLLEHSDKTVSQIAREVGLNKAGHFSAIFKRYHGISPTDYRSATRGMAD